VVGGIAYVAADEGGLRIVDVSDPASPVEIGRQRTLAGATDVYVAGSYAHVAAGGAGLRVIDVSNPSSPREVGANAERFVRRVRVAGTHAFAATEHSGLWIVDWSDPSAPTTAAGFDTWGSTQSAFVAGERVYLADRSGGLVVLASAAASAALSQTEGSEVMSMASAAAQATSTDEAASRPQASPSFPAPPGPASSNARGSDPTPVLYAACAGAMCCDPNAPDPRSSAARRRSALAPTCSAATSTARRPSWVTTIPIAIIHNVIMPGRLPALGFAGASSR
jgi:hypothetical protein